MPICIICGAGTKVHHESDGKVYLLCGHTVKRNAAPNMDRVWTGLLDGNKVTLSLKNTDFVPLEDIVIAQHWTAGTCIECLKAAEPVKEVFGLYRTFKCGHTIYNDTPIPPTIKKEPTHTPENSPGHEGGSTPDVREPSVRQHTRDNSPDYTTGHDARPVCQVCGNPGGDYLVSQLPENIRKCGHGYTKLPDKEPIRI